MKKKYIILISILILVTGWFLAIDPIYQVIHQFEVKEEHQSPCGKYALIVYMETNMKLFIGMDSSYGYRECYVELRDKNGNTLAKPFPICSCTVMSGDVGAYWDYEENRVYFTKFSYIDLSNYKIHCNDS